MQRSTRRWSVMIVLAAAAVSGCAAFDRRADRAQAHETWGHSAPQQEAWASESWSRDAGDGWGASGRGTGRATDRATDRATWVNDASGDYATGSVESFGVIPAMETAVALWDGDLNARGMHAGHSELPINSWARITNARTGQSAMVRITSRIPGGQGRTIELSRDAAAAIGALHGGPATVLVEPAAELNRAAGVHTPPRQPQPPVVTQRNLGVQGYNPDLATGSLPRDGVYAPSSQRPSASLSGVDRYLQYGAYRDPRNANDMLRRLDREGLTAGRYGGGFVETAYVDGVVYHRVRVGPLALPDARRALRDARALGHRDAAIVKP